MKTYKNINSIALGSFDGIHLGHQALIEQLCHNSALIVVGKKIPNLTLYNDKKKYSKKEVIELEFNEIRGLNDISFVQFLKKYFPNLKKIVVGYDFYFGKDRKYSMNNLKKLFTNTVIVKEKKHLGVSVHSGYIRELISDGQVNLVKEYLSRYYGFKANIIKGNGLGSKELFATFNLSNNTHLKPKNGVYITKTVLDNKSYNSISFVGNRLSVDNEYSIESHILEEFEEPVSLESEIYFMKFLRENKKFEILDELKSQISQDKEKALSYFDER
ncbi:MAG: Riboflavin kinase (EC / FMN adenylyltransferase (EC [uncultured Campylobacterales bacterium]|uniref:Riboflavin biosynthesis protein n=1 Tax=uncultured Campylobacterales bacterium TaxID=352960 RepID=A0A6S6S7D6_9BACT|nr:MAG: Riboflavin kinase (EC / FMN adenylyltransferase (EC [uncultured Campylobacterales bacterium]